MARKQWAVNSRRVAPLCRAMLRRGGKGRETGQRRNRTPVRRGSGTHVLPAGSALPRSSCRWGPPCAAMPRFPPARQGGCDAWRLSCAVFVWGLRWEEEEEEEAGAGLGSTGHRSQDCREPSVQGTCDPAVCPPPLLLAGSRGSCGGSRMPVPSTKARARQAVRRKRRERGGRLGVPAYSPASPGEGVRCSLALGPSAGR